MRRWRDIRGSTFSSLLEICFIVLLPLLRSSFDICLRSLGLVVYCVRSRRGSRSPACAGPIPARALTGLRAATEQSDPELRSFRRIAETGRHRHSSRQQASAFFFSLSSLLGMIWSAHQLVLLVLLLLRLFFRLASILLRSLGLVVVTAFLLSTASLGGSPSASSTPSALPRWDTNTAQAAVFVQHSSEYLYFGG